MGSKRAMLQNGLGGLLLEETETADRVVDLFCGAGSVALFSASKLGKYVVAHDLQEYAAALVRPVIERTAALDAEYVAKRWITSAKRARLRMHTWRKAQKLDQARWNTVTWRKRSQELCQSGDSVGRSLIWSNYGGHYFSPTQSLSLDAMLRTLPTEEAGIRDVCLAALIVAASQCAAAPGHTAQPFKATRTAGKYLREAWQRDPFAYARRALEELCPLHARTAGVATVADANDVAKSLTCGDLVFVDPPYSGVHYSRFYHVLETIARGECGPVEGVGRYPPPAERPNSAYSRRDKARHAMDDLLKTLSERGCRVILTFPQDECSNGLSGEGIEEMADAYFSVTRRSVKTRFSTLGGNTANRAARKLSNELILLLTPK